MIYQNDYSEILNFVVDKRKKSVLTLDDLAKDLHTSKPTLSGFENNKRQCDFLLAQYCSIFGFNLRIKKEEKPYGFE